VFGDEIKYAAQHAHAQLLDLYIASQPPYSRPFKLWQHYISVVVAVNVLECDQQGMLNHPTPTEGARWGVVDGMCHRKQNIHEVFRQVCGQVLV
jgi:hypothetical protein